MSRNISYRTDELARYFAHHRIAWEHFYESERVIIGQLNLDRDRAVLDIGCGCGGLGLTLRERFGVRNYTGVEINPQAAAVGRSLNPEARILSGDVLEVGAGELRGSEFDVVFSLSCVDWNVCFDEMLVAAWSFVVPGGHLVATFRLTDAPGCNDLGRSYNTLTMTESARASAHPMSWSTRANCCDACPISIPARSVVSATGALRPRRP